MALSIDHINLLQALRNNNLIGNGSTPSVLEIGEQNWFGDVDPNAVFDQSPLNQSIYKHNANVVKELWKSKSPGYLFEIAFSYYRSIFDMDEYSAFDLHGTARATAKDLNNVANVEKQYSVTTNFGTTEHIFNQAAVFETIHDHTANAGLMLHFLPHQGQYNHGFYNYQPTFFYDLAAANDYGIQVMTLVQNVGKGRSNYTNIKNIGEYTELVRTNKLLSQSGIMCVLQKPSTNENFKLPMQGVYGSEREKYAADWKETSIGLNITK